MCFRFPILQGPVCFPNWNLFPWLVIPKFLNSNTNHNSAFHKIWGENCLFCKVIFPLPPPTTILDINPAQKVNLIFTSSRKFQEQNKICFSWCSIGLLLQVISGLFVLQSEARSILTTYLSIFTF